MNRRWMLLGLVFGLCGLTSCNGRPNQNRMPAPPTSSAELTPPVRPLPLRTLPAVALVSGDARCYMRRVFFATDSADLTDEARQDLATYVRCLSDAHAQEGVAVRGRADPRGTEPYNEALSARRAESVATFLRSLGVADDRIRLRALGEDGAVEGMPDLWPMQRRVTVTPVPAPAGREGW